jgi:2-dehydro-3-deoxy-D-arabinonate dehydratase
MAAAPDHRPAADPWSAPSGHLVRVLDTREAAVVVGLVGEEGIAPLPGISTVAEVLQLGRGELEEMVTRAEAPLALERFRLLPPIDGATEVWAAGVTYQASREARVEESDDQDVYRRVYEAERPELFFKGPAWRVVSEGEPIGIRDDSPNNVPEPEVGLVLNNRGDLVGLTIVDDVSSRSIEGANPLYLPQAKVYDGSCAIGGSIAPIWLVPEPENLRLRMSIIRQHKVVFAGESSTSRMKRSFEELGRYLFRQLSFPDGAILATGTSVVPPITTSLALGDLVEIEIDGLGRLVTPAAPATAVGTWLKRRRLDPAARFRKPAPVGGG